MKPPFPVTAGVRTVVANWQVRCISTLLHLHTLNRKAVRYNKPRGLFCRSMNHRKVSIKIARSASAYEILIGDNLLGGCGEWASGALGSKPGRIAIVSNKKVFGLYGKTVEQSLHKAGFDVSVCLIGDGERFKNLRTLENALKFFGELKLSRTDCVLALGGGVVGDLAGFAASVYMRGIAFLQVPTSLLSMIDSSVGGKTGVNTTFGKNLVGTFYQPKDVLIDVKTLQTLPRREITAGLCEAVKQGAISGGKLFADTKKFVENYSPRTIWESSNEFAPLIASQVAFKASIVKADERESAGNQTSTSRKILNFGHTLAHALEKVTQYKYLKHGEAVGYGIMFAAELSKKLEFIDYSDVNLLNDVVRRTGNLPSIRHIDPQEVFESFKYDKKLVNDSLHWILLKGIGKPVIVPHNTIPKTAIMKTLKAFIKG